MFGRATSELEKPPISREKGSFEILRVWGGNDLPQQYTLNTTWEDSGAWGIMLVDIARHAAKAYGNAGNITEQEILERIRQLFDAEWGNLRMPLSTLNRALLVEQYRAHPAKMFSNDER